MLVTEFLNTRGAFLPAENYVLHASIWPDSSTFLHSTKHLCMGRLLSILLELLAEETL